MHSCLLVFTLLCFEFYLHCVLHFGIHVCRALDNFSLSHEYTTTNIILFLKNYLFLFHSRMFLNKIEIDKMFK